MCCTFSALEHNIFMCIKLEGGESLLFNIPLPSPHMTYVYRAQSNSMNWHNSAYLAENVHGTAECCLVLFCSNALTLHATLVHTCNS